MARRKRCMSSTWRTDGVMRSRFAGSHRSARSRGDEDARIVFGYQGATRRTRGATSDNSSIELGSGRCASIARGESTMSRLRPRNPGRNPLIHPCSEGLPQIFFTRRVLPDSEDLREATDISDKTRPTAWRGRSSVFMAGHREATGSIWALAGPCMERTR